MPCTFVYCPFCCCRANFRRKFEQLNQVRAEVDCPVMALTATCTSAAQETIVQQMCMKEAQYLTFSCDRPNIFLATKEMPSKLTEWTSYLDSDISVVSTLGVCSERRVYFCRTIKMACYFYEYYEMLSGIKRTSILTGNWYLRTESLLCIILRVQSPSRRLCATP